MQEAWCINFVYWKTVHTCFTQWIHFLICDITISVLNNWRVGLCTFMLAGEKEDGPAKAQSLGVWCSPLPDWYDLYECCNLCCGCRHCHSLPECRPISVNVIFICVGLSVCVCVCEEINKDPLLYWNILVSIKPLKESLPPQIFL